MKSMKKIFIGLAAVAAMGACAFCFSGNNTSDLMKSDVEALAIHAGLCAWNNSNCCVWVFGPGDEENAPGYVSVRDYQQQHVCQK